MKELDLDDYIAFLQKLREDNYYCELKFVDDTWKKVRVGTLDDEEYPTPTFEDFKNVLVRNIQRMKSSDVFYLHVGNKNGIVKISDSSIPTKDDYFCFDISKHQIVMDKSGQIRIEWLDKS